MRWSEVRAAHPDRWLVIEALEALEAYRPGASQVFDRIAVVEVCPDGWATLERYRALVRERPDRELSFAHTGMAELEIEARPWTELRGFAAAGTAR
jgi:hypothetical protein